jgi:hypothetical protein
MAIKYWAEVTRTIPEPASVQTETLVGYEVRVFEVDGGVSTERQLRGPSVFGNGYQYAAVVRLDPAADIVEGDVITKDDTEYAASNGDTSGDVFTFTVKTSKPQTYVPSLTIVVVQQSFTTIPWLGNLSSRPIRAANKTKIKDFDGTTYTQASQGYLTLTIDVPRQSTTKDWGVISRGPGGYKWQTVKVPSVIFTKRVPKKPVPTGVFEGEADVESFVSDVCNKRFIGIKARYRYWDAKAKKAITQVPLQTPDKKQVQYFIVGVLESDIKAHPTADYDDHLAAGRVKTNIWQSAGWDWVSTGKAYVEPNTKATISAQSYRNEAIAYRKKLENTDCSKQSGVTPPPGNTPPPNVTTTTTLKSAETFNPPPHIMTRHFSPIAWGGTDSYDDGNSYNQLGMFYQDPDLVSNTAKVYDTKVQKFWGFRFIFNPTFYNYQMSQSNDVDWGRKNENNAVMVTGGGTISLRLVLDRVADMNTVRRWVMGGRTATIGAPNYPVNLTPEQCEGLLRRGTEYDMEYMFRVFNGNPEKAPLLGNPVGNLEMATANLGFITSLPFIFKLNDQLRYKVILSNLTVQHDLFTKEMIPIRSLVDVTLERIPDFYYEKSKYLSIDSKTKLIQTLPAAALGSGSSSTPRRVPPRGAMGIE